MEELIYNFIEAVKDSPKVTTSHEITRKGWGVTRYRFDFIGTTYTVGYAATWNQYEVFTDMPANRINEIKQYLCKN